LNRDHLHLCAAAVLAAGLGSATAVQAGTVSSQAANASTAAPASPPPRPSATWLPVGRAVDGYHVRCWQHGRLIIDEFREGPMPDTWANTVELLNTSRSGPRVVDGQNSTCLVKPAQRRRPSSASNTP
jgi:hypothetical protein